MTSQFILEVYVNRRRLWNKNLNSMACFYGHVWYIWRLCVDIFEGYAGL